MELINIYVMSNLAAILPYQSALNIYHCSFTLKQALQQYTLPRGPGQDHDS
jgi:hypothetical protein